MITIQKITLADCDGGGVAYVVCDDNDVTRAYDQFSALDDAESLAVELACKDC